MIPDNALLRSMENDALVSEDINSQILRMLASALCDELLAAYQYWTCYQMSRGKGKSDCDPEFEAHYKEETDHAEKLMKRINELGGQPISDPKQWVDYAPVGFTPIPSSDVESMLKITIEAEKNAIAYYKNILVSATNETDPTTHKLIKSILEDEEEHLYDLERLLEEFLAD